LPEEGPIAVHEATPVGPVVAVVQAVAVKLLPAEALALVQDAVGVGPVSVVLQVVAV